MEEKTKEVKDCGCRGGSFYTSISEKETIVQEDLEQRIKRLSQKNSRFPCSIIPEDKAYYKEGDIKNFRPEEKLGEPGKYPFTRGVYETMYRGRLWTMRMFSGFGTAEQTNQRFKFLLEHGQTGLSIAFDMPTLMGYDSDHPRSKGEVGKEGVAICTLNNMRTLFKDIPLNKVSTSMTINPTAFILLAFYIAVAEEQGVPLEKLRGTIQNDILKEYIAQKEFIFPPEPSIKLIIDTVEFCAKHIPKWHPISISGYHIREAGSTAVQELAFTLMDGFTYVKYAIERGLDVDEFAPQLSFFFNSHMNFFEEIAKFRAARRIWARWMKEKFGAKKPESCRLKFHTQTAGCSLTAQQPENNIVRTAIEALAAVLGGTQSLHTNSMDEALALPAEKAAKIALRTQQIIAYETDVPDVIDPLAGSYFIEYLTNKMEKEAEEIFKKIEEMGGMVEAIKKGWPQKEISRSAYEFQKDVEDKKYLVVGINEFAEDEKIEIPILKILPEIEEKQVREVKEFKEERDDIVAKNKLEELRKAAEKNENLMPYTISAVKAHCTLGEIVEELKKVYGTWQEPPNLY